MSDARVLLVQVLEKEEVVRLAFAGLKVHTSIHSRHIYVCIYIRTNTRQRVNGYSDKKQPSHKKSLVCNARKCFMSAKSSESGTKMVSLMRACTCGHLIAPVFGGFTCMSM